MSESSEKHEWPSEIAVSEAIGHIIAFWGFKRNMGRVWSVLYLSEVPLNARELRERLDLSTGAVSMTLQELLRWGVVRKVWPKGERRDYLAAEGNLWTMISRVLRERESVEIGKLIAALEAALVDLERRADTSDPVVRRRAETQRDRIKQLLSLAGLGKHLLDALVSEARVDARALVKVLLGGRKT